MSIAIAIDGPAGSGKGTIAKLLSEKLGYTNINTGAMYRCVALETLRKNYKLEEEDKIAEIAEKIHIQLEKDGRVLLNGEDVSKKIREKDVSETVSPLSYNLAVRKTLVKKQQEIAKQKDVIMEGRDITTVVLPDADYKFYLDASIEERAKRRYLQNQEKGIEMSLEEIKENIKNRDYIDMHKEVGALKRTEDQIYIDTTNLSIDEVVEKMIQIIKEK